MKNDKLSMESYKLITIGIIEQLKYAIDFYEKKSRVTSDLESAAFFKGRGIAFREMKQLHEDILILVEAKMR